MIPWFERKFHFDYPAEMLPNICARLRGTPARLVEALESAPAQILTLRPHDAWSAQEHAGHLADMEPLWLARSEDFMQGRTQMTPADLQNRRTSEANHNLRAPGELVREFRAERQKLLKLTKGLDMTMAVKILPHPRMQTPMRLIDHLWFVAEHDDHHLAIIHERLQRG